MLVEEIFLKYSQAELLINARYSPLQIMQRGFLPSSKEKLNKKPFSQIYLNRYFLKYINSVSMPKFSLFF